MDASCNILRKDMLVADALAGCPQTATFFFKHRLDCVGCRMAVFCTLEEVCKHYSLEVDWLLAELAAIAQPGQGVPAAHSKGETK